MTASTWIAVRLFVVSCLAGASMAAPWSAVAQPASALESATAAKHEFRGAWIATVANLDWPSSRSSTPAQQKQELVDMLDELDGMGINAVIFQVRAESDALYTSEIEPWSYWLTGRQGRAPDPFYDPLQFAIDEAHRRGMELHAWFNPYRAVMTTGGYTRADGHVSVEHPEWVLDFGSHQMLDPGLPQVRDYVTSVIMDVVRRYDVDGIHFDDYFYPYDPVVSDEDAATFAQHSRGFGSVEPWRRDNVNLFVEQVRDSIKAEKPHVKFGVSPFGIWKNGVPSGIVGLDAYNVIFSDPVAWLEAQTVDYLAPQLYWSFGGGQDYATLAPWWASMANGRHLYPGLAAYKADGATFWDPSQYPAIVVPRQVRFSQHHEGIQGNVFFRAENLTRFHTKGLADSLRQQVYPHPALTPVMDWLDETAPAAPRDLAFAWDAGVEDEVTLSWDAPASDETAADARFYAVYRVRAAEAPDPAWARYTPAYLIGVTGETTFLDRPPAADHPYHYFVTAVSPNSIESEATQVVSVEGRATSTERPQASRAFALDGSYPNPFAGTTTVAYRIDRASTVSLRIYDTVGRRVTTLVDGRLAAGPGTATWDGTDARGRRVAAGVYFWVLEVDGRRQVEPVVVAPR